MKAGWKSISLVAATLGLTATAAASAQPATLRNHAAALVASGVPGAVVLTSGLHRTRRIAVGLDLVASRRSMGAGDRFRIGSVTKTFVATIVLQLAEERRLGLGDSVEHWLPGLVPGGNRITIRELLQHTSGLFNYAADPATFRPLATDPSHAWSPRDLVALAIAHEPNFAPGRGWGYSNTNYVLLGLIVERVTGNALGAELERRLFRPLGLTGTSFDRDGAFRRGARYAHGYTTIGGRTFDASGLNPSWGYAAGAMTSTAGDLATFYRR